MEVRLQQLENELRTLQGVIEKQNFELRQMKTQVDRSVSDMELRLSDIEKRNGGTCTA